MPTSMGYIGYIRDRFRTAVFSNSGWSPVIAGVLIGLIQIISYVWVNKPFTVYAGFLNWGQHIYSSLGIKIFGVPKQLPLFEPTSAGDIGVIIGASLAAALSGELALRRVGRAIDVIEAVVGGILMALGVSLAFGCNWGGFISAITSWSLHGFAFLIGAVIGGLLGLRYTIYRIESEWRKSLSMVYEKRALLNSDSSSRDASYMLLIPLIALGILVAYYAIVGSYMVGGMLMGTIVGIVLQRSRLCFATAFRDLFNGPENRRALDIHKGIAVAILVGSVGVFALKYMGIRDPMISVSPVHVTNVLGGLIFTFGSIVAGGCASGVLWRAGEGHMKSWIAILSTVLAYPIFASLLRPLTSSFPRVFLPAVVGWIGSFVAMLIFIAAYTTVIYYLEYRYVGKQRLH
ncbi:MAG: YeeE/YedE thiosulfate transporter family protein [Ignisphaera sp.]